jgi:hypothetical protein
MFLQTPTPDTSGYMIAGYAIAFIVMALYVASIYIRNRNLNQDVAMLEEMDKSVAPARAKVASKPQKKKTVTKKAGKK